MKQKTRSKEEWKKLVGEYRESGKSLREWCSERGINQSTMSNHTPLYPRASNPQNVHRSEGEWIALIHEQRTSGKSRERWCYENNINHKSMGSAVKRYASRLENIDNSQEIIESKPQEISNETSNDNTCHRAEQFCEHTEDVRNTGQTTSPSWIEIGLEAERDKPQAKVETREKKSKIIIRCSKLEIEADSDYPSSHLENLIGLVIRLTADCSPMQPKKLVMAC